MDMPIGPLIPTGGVVLLPNGLRMLSYLEDDGTKWFYLTNGSTFAWTREKINKYFRR